MGCNASHTAVAHRDDLAICSKTREGLPLLKNEFSAAKDAVNPEAADQESAGLSDESRKHSALSKDSGCCEDSDCTQISELGKDVLNVRKTPEDGERILAALREEGFIHSTAITKTSGYCFDVMLDDNAQATLGDRKFPARLAKLETVKRKSVTENDIQEKLNKAERRRKKKEEERKMRAEMSRQHTSSQKTVDTQSATDPNSDLTKGSDARLTAGAETPCDTLPQPLESEKHES